MNIIKHIFVISILTVSYNASGMLFGFGRELVHYPHELKEIYAEEALIRKNNETREQTAARHEATARKANPEAWEQRDKERSAKFKEFELQREAENMAKLEAALAKPAYVPRRAKNKMAQELIISNQNFEQKKTRRASGKQVLNDKQFIRITHPPKK